MKVSRFGSIVAVAAAFAALLALLGCQAQQSNPTTTAPSPATQSTGPAASPVATAAAPAPRAISTQAPASPTTEALKVGILASITGPSTRVGQAIERFTRFGIDDVNAKGGIKVGGKIYRLEAVTVDDRSTAEGAREAANRLVLAEKASFVTGPLTASCAGGQTVTEPGKSLLLAFACGDASLGAKFPLTLQSGIAHNKMRLAAIYDLMATEHPKVKRVAIASVDDAMGRALAEVSEAYAKAHGVSIVAREFFPADIKDFSPLVTRLLREKPDAIDSAAGARGALFLALMQTLSQQGFTGPVVAASADLSAMEQGKSFIKDLTTAVMADFKSSVIGSGDRSIVERYVQKYGASELEPISIPAYNTALVLAQGIERAGTVSEIVKIAQALRDGEWDTASGREWGKARFVGAKTFGQPSVLETPVYLSRVQGGKIETFKVMKGTMP